MLVKMRGKSATREGEKLTELIGFKETESNALRLAVCADRLGGQEMDCLARIVFRFGLSTLESAISSGVLDTSKKL